LGTQIAVYATGSFGNGSEGVFSVIMPLWAIAIGASPLMVGVLIGARHFLSLFLSIHGGAMMDRLGTRRVLVAVGILGVLTPLLFPAFPFLWAAVTLQLIGGVATSFAWMGAQAQIGELMRGSETYSGRMSFYLRFAQIGGPPLAGLSWDLGGPWGAFAFLALWGVGLFVAILFLPKPPVDATAPPAAPVRWTDLLPRFSDYVAAFKLMAVPAIALIMMLTLLRIGGNAVHFSFYVVYLKEIGYTGTIIGVLIGSASIFGFGGALSVGPLVRRFRPHWLLIATVAANIVLVAITPLLGAVFLLLLLAAASRGAVLGLSQPLMISMLSRAAGRGNQGKAVGLRATANRIAASSIPVLMGVVVEIVGLREGFFVFGGILLLLLLPSVWFAARAPDLDPRESGT
jgi:MFS family permease